MTVVGRDGETKEIYIEREARGGERRMVTCHVYLYSPHRETRGRVEHSPTLPSTNMAKSLRLASIYASSGAKDVVFDRG